jgi:hypothetical protein
MLDMIECIWNKRIKVTLNFEVIALKGKGSTKEVSIYFS